MEIFNFFNDFAINFIVLHVIFICFLSFLFFFAYSFKQYKEELHNYFINTNDTQQEHFLNMLESIVFLKCITSQKFMDLLKGRIVRADSNPEQLGINYFVLVFGAGMDNRNLV